MPEGPAPGAVALASGLGSAAGKGHGMPGRRPLPSEQSSTPGNEGRRRRPPAFPLLNRLILCVGDTPGVGWMDTRTVRSRTEPRMSTAIALFPAGRASRGSGQVKHVRKLRNNDRETQSPGFLLFLFSAFFGGSGNTRSGSAAGLPRGPRQPRLQGTSGLS